MVKRIWRVFVSAKGQDQSPDGDQPAHEITAQHEAALGRLDARMSKVEGRLKALEIRKNLIARDHDKSH